MLRSWACAVAEKMVAMIRSSAFFMIPPGLRFPAILRARGMPFGHAQISTLKAF